MSVYTWSKKLRRYVEQPARARSAATHDATWTITRAKPGKSVVRAGLPSVALRDTVSRRRRR